MKQFCAVAMLCLLAFTGWAAGYKISDLQETNTTGGLTVWIELDQGGIKSWKINADNLGKAIGTNGSIVLMNVTSNYNTFLFVTTNFVTNLWVTENAYISTNYTTNLYVTEVANINNLNVTNILILSNVTVRGNAYISLTNFNNFLVVSNLSQFLAHINVSSNVYAGGLLASNMVPDRVVVTGPDNILTNMPAGNAGQVLTSTGGAPAWSNSPPINGQFDTLEVTNNSYFLGPSLSYSLSASNAPAENELPTAHWVRSLLNNGLFLYNSTNIYLITNTDEQHFVYQYTNQIPPTASKYYPTVNAGDYIGTVATTNRFTFLQGPIVVNTYLQRTNGSGSPTVSLHAEIYISYDGTNRIGDWAGGAQTITTGTNLYQWVIAFPTIVATNTTGFIVERRFKIDTAAGAVHPDVVVHVGTNYLSGTNSASYIAIPGVNSGAAQAAVNFNEPLSVSNVWSLAPTQGVVDFGARKVVWNLTNGISFTNFAGLETGTGTRAMVLEMWLEGCTNDTPAIVLPTFGVAAPQYGVCIWTNDYAPVLKLVTNATKQWLLWEAHGTNITLDSRVYF